jgi:hypothetical protein
VGKFSDSWIGASYTNDVNEIAILYMMNRKPFKLYDPRPINISTFITMSWKAYLKTQIIRKASGHSIAPKLHPN